MLDTIINYYGQEIHKCSAMAEDPPVTPKEVTDFSFKKIISLLNEAMPSVGLGTMLSCKDSKFLKIH